MQKWKANGCGSKAGKLNKIASFHNAIKTALTKILVAGYRNIICDEVTVQTPTCVTVQTGMKLFFLSHPSMSLFTTKTKCPQNILERESQAQAFQPCSNKENVAWANHHHTCKNLPCMIVP